MDIPSHTHHPTTPHRADGCDGGGGGSSQILRRKAATLKRLRGGTTGLVVATLVAAAVVHIATAFVPALQQHAALSDSRSHAGVTTGRFVNPWHIRPNAFRSSSSTLSTPLPSRASNILTRQASKSEEAPSTEIPGLDPAIAAAVTGNPPLSVTLDDGSKYSYNDAIQRTLGWVGAAIIFGSGLWAVFGVQTGEEFFAGYLVEQSLSVDNLFVFLLLFEYFNVPLQCQDRVLNWGIYGAIIMRAVMIGLGAAALQQFHAILLVFAAILVYSSAKFFVGFGDDNEEEDPSENSIVKFSRSLFDSTDHFDGDRFFTMVDGVRKATPLFICMVAVEISDVVFAVDSIPAVFGVTEVSVDSCIDANVRWFLMIDF